MDRNAELFCERLGAFIVVLRKRDRNARAERSNALHELFELFGTRFLSFMLERQLLTVVFFAKIAERRVDHDECSAVCGGESLPNLEVECVEFLLQFGKSRGDRTLLRGVALRERCRNGARLKNHVLRREPQMSIVTDNRDCVSKIEHLRFFEKRQHFPLERLANAEPEFAIEQGSDLPRCRFITMGIGIGRRNRANFKVVSRQLLDKRLIRRNADE